TVREKLAKLRRPFEPILDPAVTSVVKLMDLHSPALLVKVAIHLDRVRSLRHVFVLILFIRLVVSNLYRERGIETRNIFELVVSNIIVWLIPCGTQDESIRARNTASRNKSRCREGVLQEPGDFQRFELRSDQRPLHSMDQLHVSPGRNHPVLTRMDQPFQRNRLTTEHDVL